MSSVDAPSPIPSPFALKAVVYATDFSPPAERAGRYASLLARKFDADLLVAHTFVLTQAAMEAEAESGHTVKSEQRQESEAALAKAVRRYGQNLRHAAPVLIEGDAHDQLRRLAREHEPSIVVMGTEGRGRVGRALLGSVAEKVVHSAGGPALTVGPQVPIRDTEEPQIRRILYATSLAPTAARGAAYALPFAQAFHADIDVLHVIHQEDVERPGSLNEMQQRFQATVESLFPALAKDISAPRGVVATGSASARIIEHIRERSIDLLVLSLRRSSHLWLESRISGAFQIIVEAPCPVLTVLA